MLGGSRGGAKTETTIAWLSENAYVSHPDYRSLVIRQTASDLSDYIFRCQRFFGSMAEIIKQPAEIRWAAGGVTRMGHWQDRDTLSKYLGHEYWKMVIEELTQSIRTKYEYLLLLGSVRSSEPSLPAQIMCTTNPGGPGHLWVRQYFVDVAKNKTFRDPDTGYTRIFIPSTVDDNPHADPDYVVWLTGLPEPLKSAWRYGSWDLYEGQFFGDFGPHLSAEPFTLSVAQASGHLYGSLDVGTSHPTSFGMWYIAPDGTIWRMFSYDMSGGNHAEHAKNIYDKIEAFPYAHGMFPEIIWFDPAAATKVKLSDKMTGSVIDEYVNLFKEKGRDTRFVPANNDRRAGCRILKMLLKGRNGTPEIRYFRHWNTTLVEGMANVVTDKNDIEVYQKSAGDDEADQTRYGAVGCWSILSKDKQSTGMAQLVKKVNRRIKDLDVRDL